MPREIVESTDVLHGDETPFGVQVGWSRDGEYVQVASVTHQQRSMWWQLLANGSTSDAVDEQLAKVGALVYAAKAQANCAPDSTPTDTEVGRSLLNLLDTNFGPFDGLYVSMDRWRINRLIRLLRKARDSAYGRDE